MATPDRPVEGEEIATDWGQAIHDLTFAPTGCIATGGAVTVAQDTYVLLPLDTAVSDPGGLLDLAGNRIVMPADSGGIYMLVAVAQESGGVDNDSLRILIQVNGTDSTTNIGNMDTGVNVNVLVVDLLVLTPGDILKIYAVKRHANGASPSVHLLKLGLIKLALEVGA